MLLRSTGLTPDLAKQSARITRKAYFGAIDKKKEILYKDLMTGFVPFLMVMNLGRLGDKAEYMDERSLDMINKEFLPLLRLQKNKFIQNLGYLERMPG